MPDDKFPKPTPKQEKNLEDFSQKDLETWLEVKLIPGLSKEDFTASLNKFNMCRFIINDDFNVFLGSIGLAHSVIAHRIGSSVNNNDIVLKDGIVRKKKDGETTYDSNLWIVRAHTWTSNPKTLNLRRAVENKILTYLQSIGIPI